jgi:hypothetical protein
MPKSMDQKPTRQPDGTFPKGISGNPKGRPKSEIMELRKQIAPKAEAIIQQVVNQALDGDLAAAKILLDRVLPPLKPVSAPVLIATDSDDSPVKKAEAFLSAAASGQISSDIAAQLIQAVANLCRIVENEELRDRIQALEAAINPKPKKP